MLDDQASEEQHWTSSSAGLPRSKDGYEPAATDKLLNELGGRRAELVREREELRGRIEELEANLLRYRSAGAASGQGDPFGDEARRDDSRGGEAGSGAHPG